ncbi:MAG: hypothetical protein MUE81_14625 [Thermoflexibacter sp.]|jgi:hypothetical protein|nr:hypothetical protein [Thermoflexibacter sp.]
MKNKGLKILFLLLMSVIIIQGCKKDEANPQDTARDNISRTWRVDPASITLNGIPISTLLAQVPAAARPDFTRLRMTIDRAGTYKVEGVDLAGVAPMGTWAFDGSRTDRIILNPGNIGTDITNLTSTTMTINYPFPTAGTIYAMLGATASVRANLVSP